MQLSQAEMTQLNQQQYLVTGTVDFSTAPELGRQAKNFFKTHPQGEGKGVEIDLSKIETCNSAGLALMLEIAKDAKANNIEVKFINLPGTLLTIAKAYGVESEIRDISQ